MTLSERIINRKSTVNANTVFMSAPASSLLWADMEKRQLRGPPRASGASVPTSLFIKKLQESRDGVAFRSLLTDNPAGTKVGAGLVPARS